MIIKAVRTLSNLAIANEEHRRLVVECGGKDVIEVIAETYVTLIYYIKWFIMLGCIVIRALNLFKTLHIYTLMHTPS